MLQAIYSKIAGAVRKLGSWTWRRAAAVSVGPALISSAIGLAIQLYPVDTAFYYTAGGLGVLGLVVLAIKGAYHIDKEKLG